MRGGLDWQEIQTPSGDTCYHNTVTDEYLWERPKAPSVEQAANQLPTAETASTVVDNDVLPPGW